MAASASSSVATGFSLVTFECAHPSAEHELHVVGDHPNLGPCLVENLYQYATGNLITSDDVALVDWHQDGFELSYFRIRALLRDIALSPGFRTLSTAE